MIVLLWMSLPKEPYYDNWMNLKKRCVKRQNLFQTHNASLHHPPLSSGDGVPAVPLQQPQALHPDPGRQRPGEDQVGGPPQRAPPHPEEEQAQGALRLRPQGGLRQHPAPHQDDTVCCYHRWALNKERHTRTQPSASVKMATHKLFVLSSDPSSVVF